MNESITTPKIHLDSLHKLIDQLQAQNKLLTKSNDFYADLANWIVLSIKASDSDTCTIKSRDKFLFGGKLAREIQRQIKELEK